MNLHIDIHPHTFHFRFAAGTSRGVYYERQVWLLHLYDCDKPNFDGVGECAPLYDLSSDYTPQYEDELRELCNRVSQRGELLPEDAAQQPSMRFGLETAFLAAQAHAKGRKVLFHTPFTQGKQGIPINGLIWMGDYDTMHQRLQKKMADNYRCIKIKIGAIHFDDELKLLAEVRKQCDVERVQLRVDANGAFSPFEALEKLHQLSAFHIHSIEQPIRPRQWDVLAHLCKESPIPIALDEELIGLHTEEDKCRMLDVVRPQYLVLKPTLHGGLQGCEEWICLATQRGIGWWVTSALESNIGLSAIAQWVSTKLTSSSSIPPLAQGLGTGQLFTDNIPCEHLSLKGDTLWYKP